MEKITIIGIIVVTTVFGLVGFSLFHDDIHPFFTPEVIEETTAAPVDGQITDAVGTDEQVLALNYMVIENLIGNLIERYDEVGLDGLRNANYVATLTGNTEGTRYLYIIDPLNGVVGKPDESFGLQLVFPPMHDSDSIWLGYADRYPASLLEDINIQRYFKMHDGLIFTSGFPIDEQGLPK